MKKTVIKRRKRVPAAGPTGQRLSDQAAAEALVSVGRVQGAGGGHMSGEGDEEEAEGEDEAEAPQRKRARRGRGKERDTTRTRSRGGAQGTDRDDAEGEDEVSGRDRSRESAWAGVTEMQVDRPSSSSGLDREHAARGLGALAFASASAAGSPHHHGGFDLPPLAALGASGAPFHSSSYLRSSSNAPSRTHSPLSGPAAAYGHFASGHHVLPPGTVASGMYFPRGHSPVAAGGVPTTAELERHYYELHEQRRGLMEMLERTDRLMAGVKRGIEEMRSAAAGGSPHGSGSGAAASTNAAAAAAAQAVVNAASAAAAAASLSAAHDAHTAESAHAMENTATAGASAPAPTLATAASSVPLNRSGSVAGERKENVWTAQPASGEAAAV